MSKPRHRCRLAVLADYHQFYIWDPQKSGQKAPEDWSNEDIVNRAKIAPSVVVVCPVRNGMIPVEVGIWDSEPQVIFDAWQHIIIAPLLTDGLIEIHECIGGSHACFSVEPGSYTVRALYRGLDTLSENGLKGKDFYEIQIWRLPCTALRVIKQWVDG